MVQAILAGRKTQTRRVVKSAINCLHYGKLLGDWPLSRFNFVESGVAHFKIQTDVDANTDDFVKCPYGVVGDRLWVREGYRQELNLGHDKNGNWPDAKSLYSYFYKADCDNPKGWGIGVWKSPMFMPRDASRIELEITGIRVERVQDISEADARSEGITDGGCLSCGNPELCGCCNPKPDARDSYIWLWHKINGKKHPWSSNPWVWVVEFKRVDNCQNCVHANQGACCGGVR